MCRKLILLFCFLSHVLHASTGASPVESPVLGSEKAPKENLIDFVYDQKDLKDIVNTFASRKGINIIYSEANPLTSQVTFDAGRKVTLKTAWELVIMLLDKAGFSLLPRGKNLYVVVANTALSTEQVPLYVNIDYRRLPNTAEKIRYMFYFENIILSSQQASLDTILKTIFPSATFTQNVMYDPTNNGIIFTGDSSLIKSAMLILDALDEPGYQEHIEIINLTYAGAADVVTVLNSLLQNSTTPTRGYIPKKSSTKKATFFDTATRVVNLDPNNIRKVNTLIVFGKRREVEKVVNFISKHIDIPQEDGKAFYHVIELQHLKASDVATQLTSLVSGSSGYSSQSRSSLNSDLAFDSQTKILAESVSVGSSQDTSSSNKNQVQRGGNRLIIAANKRDWVRLEKLIADLDQPQKQVIIEALVLDLDILFTRQLSSQIRTRGLEPTIFPKYMQAQAGLLAKSQLTSNNDYRLLLGNLNQILGTAYTSTVAGQNSSASIGSSTPTDAFQESTVVMVNSGSQADGVWAFFQLLSNHSSAKVLTRPFIIARNNQEASIVSTIQKRLVSSVSAGVSATVSYTKEDAPVTIRFTPLISENNEVNLQNHVEVTYWNVSDDVEAANQRFTRTLENNVSLRNGDVLILGGLTRTKTNSVRSEVPFLSKIPLIGNLFSSRVQTQEKDQLFILLRPTIVEPRTQGGMGAMTSAASRIVKGELAQTDAAFSNLKDPINRWFYGGSGISAEVFDNSLTELYESDGVSIEKAVDTRYQQKIEPIATQATKKKKAEQQAASNQLQYQLHGAENPYDSKKKPKKKSRKKKKRKSRKAKA